jgi:hypothetical protein
MLRTIEIASVAVIVSMSTAPAAGPPATPEPGTSSLPKCIYNNASYTSGAVICVGPGFGQSCNDKGFWDALNSPESLKDACVKAQFTSPGAAERPAIPANCTYHDVSYTNGAIICIAPGFGQTCNPNGSWSDFSKAGIFATACKNAQIPSPTGVSTGPAGSKN